MLLHVVQMASLQTSAYKVATSSNNKTYQGYGQEQTYVDTTLRVRLGEWFEIGGNTESNSSESKGILYRTKKNEERYNKIFLKIELSN